MSRAFWGVIAIASSVAIGGCSIHPLPEDYSGVPTTEIAFHIRCETKQALQDIVSGYLSNFRDANGMLHAQTNEIGNELTSGQREFSKNIIPLIHIDARKRLTEFEETAIAYGFRFELTEDNGKSGGMTLSMPFTSGSISIGFGSGLVKQRINERKFRIAESFGGSLLKLDCAENKNRSKNIVYPITGKIGMLEMLQTFVSLALKKGLRPGDEKVATFTDALTFTTTLTGSITPTLKLNAVARDWRVTEATATLSAGRTDLHEVEVGINLSKKKDASGKKVSKASRKEKAKDDALRALEKNEQIRALRELSRGL